MADCKCSHKDDKKLSYPHEKEHRKENRNDAKMKPPLCRRHKEQVSKQLASAQKSKPEKPECPARTAKAKYCTSTSQLLSPCSSQSHYTPKPRQAPTPPPPAPPSTPPPPSLAMKKHKERERGGQTKEEKHCRRTPCKMKSPQASPDRCPSLSLELLSPFVSAKPSKQLNYNKKCKNSKPVNAEGADGDHLLYKNSTFGLDFTESEVTVKSTEIPQKAEQPQDKDSSPLVKSAREHYKKMNERLRSKCFQDDLLSSDCESRKSNISGKSGEELRSIIFSQIKIQEIIDETTRKLNEIKEQRDGRKCAALDKWPEIDKSLQKLKIGDKTKKGSTLEVLSDDVVSPLVRKVRRMYLKTLDDQMSLLEDLEQLPGKCNYVLQTNNEEEAE